MPKGSPGERVPILGVQFVNPLGTSQHVALPWPRGASGLAKATGQMGLLGYRISWGEPERKTTIWMSLIKHARRHTFRLHLKICWTLNGLSLGFPVNQLPKGHSQQRTCPAGFSDGQKGSSLDVIQKSANGHIVLFVRSISNP